MPDESLITQLELIFEEIIDLGGQNERTKILPNLVVQDANPAGLTGFVIVSDGRDGDNILAKKVPSVVYVNNDTVNVLFQKGGEAIAFQQGSQSGSGDLWEIVPSTSTDIYYNKGDVGIGKSVAPDASLEILSTSQSQLQLTHTEDTKYATLRVDTNHDLTISTTSTGQIILQPTANSIDFFQVLDAASAVVLQTDTTNKRLGIGKVPVQELSVSGDVELSGFLGIGITSPTRDLQVKKSNATGAGLQVQVFNESVAVNSYAALEFQANNGGVIGQFFVDGLGGVVAGGGMVVRTFTSHPVVFGTNQTEAMRIDTSQNVGIGTTTISAQLHVDQASTTAAIPVLYLDQADVSEEMIEFNTTIGVGNAIEAVGAKTMTPTHFVKVTLPGGLTRYFEVGTIA